MSSLYIKLITSYFLLILLCIVKPAQCQTISNYEMSLAEKLFENKSDFEKFSIFINKAHGLNNVNPDSSKILYLQCDSFLLKLKKKEIRHRNLLDYAYQRCRIGDADESLRIISDLDKDKIDLNNYFISFCYHRIKSQSYKSQNKLKEAIEAALIAKQKIADGSKTETDQKKAAYNRFFVINIQSDISNLYKDTKQIEKSVALQQENLKLIGTIDDKTLELADKKEKDKYLYLANSYNNLALTLITYLEQQKKPEPDSNIVNNLNKAIALSQKINNKVFLGAAYYNLSNYYGILKNYELKKNALIESLKINEELNNLTGIIFCKSELSGVLIKLNGDPKEALKLADEALEAARSYEELGSKAGVYLAYCEALNYNNKVTEAIKYFDTANTLKTEELKSTFDKEITEMQTKYETVEKEKQIIEQESKIKQRESQMRLLYGGVASFALVAGIAYKSYLRKKKDNVIITREKQRSEELLLNILPAETAEELKATGAAKAKSFDMVTVLFTDFKNFTQASEKLSAEELVNEINFCYSEFDKIITRHGIEKIKTIGDAYMCAGGLPVSNQTHATDVVNAGLEMIAFIEKNKMERIKFNLPYFELRLGIHTGPVVAGIVGIKKFAYDIWGDTVNTASRMESSGEVGKVNISGTTYELIKDKYNCINRGKIQAKNKGEIYMYFVTGAI